MIYKVRYYGDPVLRRRAKPVTRFDDKLKELTRDMLGTMYDANGVGLAAPQIGLSTRVFVALELAQNHDEAEGEVAEGSAEAQAKALSGREKRERWGVVAEHVMVNPELVARSGTQYGTDGCLSLPGLVVEAMKRDEHVRVRFQDVTGAAHERDAEGHFAHVIQHELDHLDGVLFFDRLPEDDRREFLTAHRTELAEFQREAKGYLRELKNAKQDATKDRVT